MNNIQTTKIFGVSGNATSSFKNEMGFNKRKEILLKKNKHSFKISELLKNIVHGDKLKEKTRENIFFLTKIRTMRGIRHRLKYPTRGQRTHTNAKTRKKSRN